MNEKQSYLMRRYFFARRTYLRLKELQAPSRILDRSRERYRSVRSQMRRAGLLAAFPKYEPFLERERQEQEAEEERKLSCLHCAEHFVSNFVESEYDADTWGAKPCCEFGGLNSGHPSQCRRCPHWKQISDDDCDRLDWHP